MPRLAQMRFVSIGHPNARFDDITLDLRDGRKHATDSTLWLRNGGGKSSILNLFFALVRPDRRDFLGGKAEARRRNLDDYILANDRGVVACEWELDQPAGHLNVEAEPEALLTGVFYEWRSGTATDDTRLRRLYFACLSSPSDPRSRISDLPLFVSAENGRRNRRTMSGFRQEWTAFRDSCPHLQVFATESQREWTEHLDDAGIDPELFSYQIKMNQREGGVDELFRFEEHEQFVDFLLELALDPALGERVSRNLATYRRELSDRRNKILPERELLQGLASHLGPIVEIAAERTALRQDVSGLAYDTACLTQYVDQRVGGLIQEEAKHAEIRDREAAAAKEARELSIFNYRRVSALRRFAAERRLARASEDLERAKRQMEDAQRHMLIWEAAVPLYHALRFEREAREYQEDLARKQQEAAPLLAELQKSALALAAALLYRIRDLRRRRDEGRIFEKAAREETRTCMRYAADAQERAARADAQVRLLEKALEDGRKERSRLETLALLKVGESGIAAIERLGQETYAIEERVRLLADKVADLRLQVKVLGSDRELATAEATRLQTSERQEQRLLDLAVGIRKALEDNRILRRYLEVESIDVEKLSDQALGQLQEAAHRALEQIVKLEIERAADNRAVLHLDQKGLLPPIPDSEEVLGFLQSRLPAAWSGWSYIEANVLATVWLRMR